MIRIALVLASVIAAPPTPSQLVDQGVALARAGNLKAARAKLENAYQAAPESPAVLWNLAQLRDALGDTKGAVEAYEAYLGAVPTEVSKSELEARLRLLRRALAVIPDDAREALKRGIEAVRSEDLREAARLFRVAADASTNWDAPWFNEGMVRARLDEPAEALACFQKALRVSATAEVPRLRHWISQLSAALAARQRERDERAATERAEREAAERAARLREAEERDARRARELLTRQQQEVEQRRLAQKQAEAEQQMREQEAQLRATRPQRVEAAWRRRTAGVTLSILGGVAAGTSGVLLGVGAANIAHVEAGGLTTSTDVSHLISGAGTLRTASLLTCLLAGALLVVGVPLLFANWNPESLTLNMTIDPTGGSLVVRGAFP